MFAEFSGRTRGVFSGIGRGNRARFITTLLAAGLLAVLFAGPVEASGEITIGEINSYSGMPAFTCPIATAGNWPWTKSTRPAE